MTSLRFIILLQCFVLLCCGIEFSHGNDNIFETLLSIIEQESSPGEPLYLTKFIESGKLEEGRQAALVEPFVKGVVSYSGYVTVNKVYNSNMFFWYFQSETDYKNAPTVIWLQGGPGTSMYLGLFEENGPYIIDRNNILKREYRWSRISNLIYIDNPVGTGYSFTENESGYASNETQVGKDLYETLVQIFKLFPYLQKNDLFITGESYAGKYVPALGFTIHEKNQNKPEVIFNLKGLMIGNGFTDPVHMVNYGDYLYQLGLIDDNARNELLKMESLEVDLINHGKWANATEIMNKVIGDNETLIFNYTGVASIYNYLDVTSFNWTEHENDLVSSNYFRRRVHVGNRTLNDGSNVYNHLHDDIMKSVIEWVVLLLQHHKILFYSGQLDIICSYPLTENFLKNMNWSLSGEYKVAKRQEYKIDGNIAGYYKTVGNLTEALIRDAGHMVPSDQPFWAYQLFKDFLNDKFAAKQAN